MATLIEYAALCATHRTSSPGYYVNQDDSDWQVLVKEANQEYWTIYVPNAGSMEAAVTLAGTMNEQARKDFHMRLKEERNY